MRGRLEACTRAVGSAGMTVCPLITFICAATLTHFGPGARTILLLVTKL